MFIIGKRICIGERVARQELFLIFTRMLQMFEIESVEGDELPNPNEASRFLVHWPPKFNVKFMSRKQKSS